MIFTLSCITPFSTLLSDVGIIEVGADEVIDFLCRSTSYPTSSRSSQGDKGYAIHRIKLLLNPQEITPRVVMLTSDIGVLTTPDATHDTSGKRPAILTLPRGIGIGKAITIGTIAIRVGQTMLSSIERGTSRDIIRYTDTPKARRDRLKSLRSLLQASHIIESSPESPCRVT